MRTLPLIIGLVACRSPKLAVTEEEEGTIDEMVDADNDGYTQAEDCDDQNPLVNPGTTEVCDGIDNNCDEQIDEGVLLTFYNDEDLDGFGDPQSTEMSCEAFEGVVPNANDCDDSDPSIFPAAIEICDGIDNNCDEQIDEGLGELYFIDNDRDGYGDSAQTIQSCGAEIGISLVGGDCDDESPLVYPEAPEMCDDVDNDCDGDIDEEIGDFIWYLDGDNDGYGDPGSVVETCFLPEGYVANYLDCDDSDSLIYPFADELCDNLDNDCDGYVDDDDEPVTNAGTWYLDHDADGYGDPSLSIQRCEQPTGYVSDNTDCNDLSAVSYPGADEICDSLDNDCDGDTDDDDPSLLASSSSSWYLDSDTDGYGDPNSTISACSAPSGYVSNADDCDDNNSPINPSADEICDEIDNDCDGDVDDDDPGLQSSNATIWYLDHDEDGYGDPALYIQRCEQPESYVSDNTDCNDLSAVSYPGADEICDSLDNDCDGDTDDDDPDLIQGSETTWYLDNDEDGYGDATFSIESCSAPNGYIDNNNDCDDSNVDRNPGATETCDSLDNDCDNDIDEGLLGQDSTCPGESCLDIYDSDSTALDGTYYIDPDASGAYEIYCDMANGGWTLVLKSMVDNTELIYDSFLWTSTALYNETDHNISGGNNSKYNSYNNLSFSEMRIVMNGYDQSFSFSSSHTSLYDVMNGGGDYASAPSSAGNYYTTSYWGFSASGHERYHCREFGINQDFYGDGSIARLGFQISQEYGCGHPGTAEGLGMKERNNGDYLNSGRLQWANEANYFSSALVYVR
ncbi:MAG: putative metal-binding motif-containing protein [Myxococcota bacterium]|nr:putative metal-binding motif-containing protein [Myxococcota bacterium]